MFLQYSVLCGNLTHDPTMFLGLQNLKDKICQKNLIVFQLCLRDSGHVENVGCEFTLRYDIMVEKTKRQDQSKKENPTVVAGTRHTRGHFLATTF